MPASLWVVTMGGGNRGQRAQCVWACCSTVECRPLLWAARSQALCEFVVYATGCTCCACR